MCLYLLLQVRPVVHCRALRAWSSTNGGSPVTNGNSANNNNNNVPDNTCLVNNNDGVGFGGAGLKESFFESLKLRGFESLVLLNANDADVFDFIQVNNIVKGSTVNEIID